MTVLYSVGNAMTEKEMYYCVILYDTLALTHYTHMYVALSQCQLLLAQEGPHSHSGRFTPPLDLLLDCI